VEADAEEERACGMDLVVVSEASTVDPVVVEQWWVRHRRWT
jgi:hypothetical protein